MDVQQKLDEIVTAVEGARAMPMSASCVVNRSELLAMLQEVREALPGSLAQAEQLLGGREQMVAEAQAEAQRIIESGHAERGSLVAGTEVVRQAQAEAEQLLAQARQEAADIRDEADDYVDSKLANFEVVLSKTIGSVERGREKLLGSGPGSEEWNAAVLSKTLEAVGRGRKKLLGHRPSDELGAHMAAQDAAEQAVHTSDADFMADLAALGQDQQAGARPAAAPPQPEQPVPSLPPQSGFEPAAAAADPYAAHAQQQAAQQEAYYGDPGQDAYAHQQQYAYYGQQPDPYYAQQPQMQPQQPQVQPQQPQLDETSFFDTSMIDLDRVREYEAHYDQIQHQQQAQHQNQHQGQGQGAPPWGQGYGQGG